VGYFEAVSERKCGQKFKGDIYAKEQEKRGYFVATTP